MMSLSIESPEVSMDTGIVHKWTSVFFNQNDIVPKTEKNQILNNQSNSLK